MLIYSYTVQVGLSPENNISQLKMGKANLEKEVTQKDHRHTGMCSGAFESHMGCGAVHCERLS